ncbi:MAG TPA: hypothetical protein VNW53_18330 [Phenylobacterium sp.]|jgi:hypothetical protein|uniref:hypothetical protein n=1 Tax=Phenylobacterium sp. TaxID=1871053 RepID=UPI002C078913|nr:hypothetical protein [Phenylobacterium sp.]HXA40964.1 hypothetical protein [Phenylobacterium sp.]
MFKTLSTIRSDARAYREWFEFVGRTLASGPARSTRDLATMFCTSGEPLDGKPTTAEDFPAVVGALTPSLVAFQGCKLISGEMEARFTKSLRVPVPERVAHLTARGTRVLDWPGWRVEFLFQRYQVAQALRRLWKPFAGAVGVAGVFATLLKLVLMWNTEQAAIAGALAGVAALASHLLSARP